MTARGRKVKANSRREKKARTWGLGAKMAKGSE